MLQHPLCNNIIGGSQIIKAGMKSHSPWCRILLWSQHQMKLNSAISWHFYDDFDLIVTKLIHTLVAVHTGKMARRVSMPSSLLSTIPEVVQVQHQDKSDNKDRSSSSQSIFGPFLRKTSLFTNLEGGQKWTNTWAIRRGKAKIKNVVSLLEFHIYKIDEKSRNGA